MVKQTGLAITALALPFPLTLFSEFHKMINNTNLDVIIVGGSYSGLSATMALGRALRKVLIIDGGAPCNRHTPHSHNFITQDGEKPSVIADKSRAQVLKYPTVKFINDIAQSGSKTETGFSITTASNQTFEAKRLIFATGLKDNMPSIKGFSECWGISVIHCPYCHGYEVRNQKTGIFANGEDVFHYAKLISNWTKDLTIFTNGASTLTEEQTSKINEHNIKIIEKEIVRLNQKNGQIKQLVFKDNTTFNLDAIYHRAAFEQHCKIPQNLGCELSDQGLLKVDMFQKNNIEGVFACGDNASPLRSVAYAVATGNIAGAALNNSLIESEF